MAPDRIGRSRLHLSLRRFHIVVVFCAVGLAAHLSLSRAPHVPLGLLVLQEVIGLPWVFAALSLVLVRRGPLRGWLVSTFLCVSIGTCAVSADAAWSYGFY